MGQKALEVASFDDDRRERLRALFDAAQQSPPDQRRGFLLSACPSDPELRAEVESLLNADDSHFLESPPALSTVGKGTKLGAFELRDRIGRGGMGEVWRAHDSRLKRDIALKILPALLATDPDRVARFEREARAASALNHPNIVSVFDIGSESGLYWIVSELIDGESLRDRMSRGMVAQRRALEIAAQVAHGLAAAHAAGLVHRDLKPGNIMLHRDGRVKLVDFGLVKSSRSSPDAETMTESGIVLGTPGYMAPEQVRGETLDARTDIFSFGVVLYEMLSGRRAFSGVSQIEQLHAILNDEPLAVPPSVPAALERIVRRCLEKDPGRRFQSAADVAFVLDGSPYSTAPPIVKDRKPVLWIAFAAALAAAIILGLLQLTRPLPAPRVVGLEALTRNSRLLLGSEETFLPLLSDGSRLFFPNSSDRYSQIAVEGGEPVPLDSHLGKFSYLLDISSDHKEFLVCHNPQVPNLCQLWVEPVIGGTPRRLGNLESDGYWTDAWSPDGKFLVYSRNGNVFLATHAGAKLRQLASFPGTAVIFPHWSPDSSKIRFTVSRNAVNRIWEVQPDGTGLRKYLPDWKPEIETCCGNWTPDNHYFEFLANSKIWIVRENAGFHREAGTPNVLEIGGIVPGNPLPSLDGKRLFFVGGMARTEYLHYEPTTGQLSSQWPGLSEGGVEFSKEGKSISVISLLDQTLFKAAADGTQRVQLTSPPLRVDLARWSPDGKQVAFMGYYPGMQTRIYLISADGGAPRQVTHGESAGGYDSDPSWSPDGDSLAFGGQPTGKPEEESIRVLDMKSGRISALTGSQGVWSPRWSPDGRWIAGLLDPGSKLVLYDLQTKQQTVVIEKEAGSPNWTRDSRFLFCWADEGWWRVDIQSKKVALIKPPRKIERALGGWFTLAPDGSIIAAQDAGSAAIYGLDWDLP